MTPEDIVVALLGKYSPSRRHVPIVNYKVHKRRSKTQGTY
jgi:hypothetical protein